MTSTSPANPLVRTTIVALLGIFLLLAGRGDALQAQSPRSQQPGAEAGRSVYIVQMLEDPIVNYTGGIPGLAATKPPRGQHVNPSDARVQRYQAFLERAHANAIASVGASPAAKLYDYAFSFNGFAALLTPSQAARLSQQANVVTVKRDQARQLHTDNTPVELGLAGPTGLWATAGDGEGVVIGVIDTGIWPEHPSFSDQSDLAYRPGPAGNALRVYDSPPSDWHGRCDSGQRFSQRDCNNKLIGARYFVTGAAHQFAVPADYISPRDHDGHGTHTASTAGGNAGVDPAIFGRDLGVETISGMAPRARIAAYKACFGEVGCFTSDLTAAIDAAVADGVDVINYSIGSNTPDLLAADAVAFLFAADAGVFVATSAGNAGPGPSTVGSPAASPWLTAVGASTHGRRFDNTVTLGNGATYVGGSVTAGIAAQTRLIDGGEECPDGLDPAEATGAIVLCLRVTGIARVEHGAGVRAAGGVGMILYDPPQFNVTPTDNHVLPTSTVFPEDGLAIAAYIADEGASATASLTGGAAAADAGAPDMAVFSSRGPNGGSADVIKPDVTAPGVQILAGASPTPHIGAAGQLFQAIQGTSMSSPHVAGVAAVLLSAHPDWTPAMIRSALVTTASQDVDKEDGTTPADPFDFGGGHIAPLAANGPGLVYEAGFVDYLRFLCGSAQLSATSTTCTAVGAADPSDLNLPTIAVGQLAGVQTVTRTVTNIGEAGTYTVSVAAPAGISVVVEPAELTLAAGESATYEVTLTNTGAAFDAWTFGSLTWSDGVHNVRSPLALRPVSLSAPEEVFATGSPGSLEYEVTFGYTGPFTTAVYGLVPAVTEAGNVVDDPADEIEVALETGIGITEHVVSVPAGTQHLRFATFDGETDGADDLDLYLYDPSGNLVDFSAGVSAQEQVDASVPASGDWKLIVHGWETDGADSNYILSTWLVPAADAGNLTVAAPAAATIGVTAEITLSWTGLVADTRYLGIVAYENGITEFARTIVRITG
jgi:subtilisin family serine protease